MLPARFPVPAKVTPSVQNCQCQNSEPTRAPRKEQPQSVSKKVADSPSAKHSVVSEVCLPSDSDSLDSDSNDQNDMSVKYGVVHTVRMNSSTMSG